MKTTKRMVNFVVLVAFFCPSMALANGICVVKPNPSRGVDASFEVDAGNLRVGDVVKIKTGTQTRTLGTISEVVEVPKSQSGPFNLIMGFIHEEDVSGVQPSNLGKIDLIRAYRIDTPNFEALLYHLFSGKKKMGGSLLLDGMGSSCL